MMIDPISYAAQYKKYTYAELISVRDELQRDLVSMEQEIQRRKREQELVFDMRPSLETRYSVSLDYMAALCNLMAEKFREERWAEEDEEEDEASITR